MSAVSELERLSLLVDTIYRGATEPDIWPKIVADVTAWLESPKGMLFTPLNGPEQGGIYFPHGLPDFHLELYKSRYQAIDMWAQQAVRLGKFREGNVLLGTDLVSQETLNGSRWYDEFLRHSDISHLLTSVVFEVKPTGAPAPLAGYSVDDAAMSMAAEDAIVLHCLPAYRGSEIAASVIDGPQSVVFDEAENRLHAQKALLSWLVEQSPAAAWRAAAPGAEPT